MNGDYDNDAQLNLIKTFTHSVLFVSRPSLCECKELVIYLNRDWEI